MSGEAAAIEGGAMAEPAGASTTGPIQPVQVPIRDRRRGLRLSTPELLSIIGLSAGFVVWLSHVSLTAGSLSTKVEGLERQAAEQKVTLEAVKVGVGDLRVGIEQRGADLRERLARIEALLMARSEGAGK